MALLKFPLAEFFILSNSLFKSFIPLVDLPNLNKADSKPAKYCYA